MQVTRFVPITSDMVDEVIEHLRNNFFADEPLNRAVSLCERGQPHEELEQLCAATIADQLSVAAICGDTTDKILECRIISVDRNARGRGLAKKLMEHSMAISKKNGLRVFKADATGAYSQRICSSLGMEPVKTVRYEDYRDHTGTPVFIVPPPHESLVVMVKEV